MNESQNDRSAVYEIGYLIGTSIPEETVPAEGEKIKKIVTDAGASIISDEAPRLEHLAYTMRKKTVSGAYDKFDDAYFGWVKFELASDAIEGVKKAITNLPSVIRSMVITTVRETTYLGKRASAIAKLGAEEKLISKPVGVGATAETPAATATVEEMDKSIDEMVKEV